jgi:hypothetical protein
VFTRNDAYMFTAKDRQQPSPARAAEILAEVEELRRQQADKFAEAQ